MRHRAVLLLAVAGLALPAASAGAAYAPRLEVRADPATPYTPSGLTFTVRQAPGEGANRTEVVRFPPAFGFNPGFSVTGCAPEQEAEEACPESSRIGTASAQTELGSFAGPVHLTRDFRVAIFLRGFEGLVRQKVEGVLRVGPDGWIESVLDGLPPVRSTFAQVRLEAGPRSLVLTPRDCGSYAVDGRFTSHDGETATPRALVAISGCPRPPAIAGLAARARRGRVDVGWALAAAAARAELVLERRIRLRPWVRWRRVRTIASAAAAGPARRRLSGPRGARLRPGRYRATLTTYGADGVPVDRRRAHTTVRR